MKKVSILITVLFLTISAMAQNATEVQSAPYSKFRKVNETLYIAGQIARNPESGELVSGDIKAATNQCMQNIGSILKLNKMDFKDLMMVQIFLLDLDNYGAVNEAYREFFKDEVFPARLCLEVSKIPGGSDIEISAIAEKKSKALIDLP